MTILPHVAFGAAVGSLIPNPYLASGAGFISHFVLDFIPHWDPNLRNLSKRRKIFYGMLFLIDLCLSVTLLWFLKDYKNIFFAGLIGALVDLENFYHFIPIHDSRKTFWHRRTTPLWGLFNQSWVTGFSLLFLIYSLHARTS